MVAWSSVKGNMCPLKASFNLQSLPNYPYGFLDFLLWEWKQWTTISELCLYLIPTTDPAALQIQPAAVSIPLKEHKYPRRCRNLIVVETWCYLNQIDSHHCKMLNLLLSKDIHQCHIQICERHATVKHIFTAFLLWGILFVPMWSSNGFIRDMEVKTFHCTGLREHNSPYTETLK